MRRLPYCCFPGLLASLVIFLAPGGASTGARSHPADAQPCGGSPNYCANSTRNIVRETPMAPPPANTPFRDPDFGSRMVRVTDANTLGGVSFHTDSAGETNEWSKFDPSIGEHGGYRFWVDGSGGGTLPFELDATTMHVARIGGRQAKGLGRRGNLPLAGEFSYTNPDVLFGTWGTRVMEYNFTNGKVKQVYDFDKCPGLPKHLERHMHTGGFTISGDDTKFAYTFGGGEQDQSKLAVFYDRSANGGAGACYWYDSRFGTVGGTNVPPTPVAGGVGQLAAPAAPKVTASPGSGSLPSGDYYVEITARSRLDRHFGETPPSAETGPVHLASPGTLTITFPSLANPDLLWLPPRNSGCWRNGPRCTPFNVYIGTSPGSETLQNKHGPVGGQSYTRSTPLKHSSRRPPAVNTAGYTIHDARMSKSGTVVRVTEAFRGTEYFWIPGTPKVTPCITWQPNRQVAGYCGGHLAMGYSHLVNATGYFDDMGIVIHPLSDLSKWRLLIDPLPSPVEWTEDKHFSWSDANASDTMPVCGSLYIDANVRGGNGTQNVLTNPLLQIHRAWDREIFCLATTGPSRVWRFAHDRATGTSNANARVNTDFWATPKGNVSQDGKFYLFTSNWEWSLGNDPGTRGCPSAGRCRSDVFIVELH
jgi:hypothetical protein